MPIIKKAHLRFTIVCTVITSIILLLASLAYLFVAESNLKDNQYQTFQEDTNSMVYNLETQTVISHDWLAKLEADNRNLIFLEDNGYPLLFGSVIADQSREALYQNVKNYYAKNIAVKTPKPLLQTFQSEFIFTNKKALLSIHREQYYAFYCYFPRYNGNLEVYILHSLKPIYTQIYKQRVLFAVIGLPAILFLYFFYYFFIKQLLKPIAESQRKQNQFIAAASHEFRTPLAVIASCISAMKQSAPSHLKGQPDFIHILENESHRMTRLINDMLFLTNRGNPSQQFQFKSCELETIVLDCYESFEQLALEHGLSLQINLPETPMPLCNCDADKLKQLVAILLHNAISYTPSGGSISLSASYKKNQFSLLVADNGIGIPNQEKNKIFEQFFRSDRSRSKKNHFGLGLSIAQEIAFAHCSHIIVTDTPGGGSTFTLTLSNDISNKKIVSCS
jgi:signal transduction histidine kinase